MWFSVVGRKEQVNCYFALQRCLNVPVLLADLLIPDAQLSVPGLNLNHWWTKDWFCKVLRRVMAFVCFYRLQGPLVNG